MKNITRFTCFASLIFNLALLGPGLSTAKDLAFVISTGQRQLFLDDWGIAKLENLKRTMHEPDKKGAVIRIDPGVPGSEQHSLLPGPVIYDPDLKIYKTWCTVPHDAFPATGYWESKDGLHWTKPIIGMVEYKGSRENNYVRIDLGKDTGRFTPAAVVYDVHDTDPNRRYKCALPPFGFGVSNDGIHWTGLRIHVKNQDSFSFSYDPQDRLFILAMREGGLSDRRVTLSTSRDFTNWTEPELIFRADELDQQLALQEIARRYADPTLQEPEFHVPSTVNAQVYAMTIMRYEGLYLGFPLFFYRSGHVDRDWPGFKNFDLKPKAREMINRMGDWTGLHVTQLMCSRDLRNWHRLGDRKPFIRPSRSDSGAYDTQGVLAGHYVVRDDELWFYYGGLKSYANVSIDKDDQGAACLAILRRDGFISLDAAEQEGSILTQPFQLSDVKLVVNVDAPHGQLQVEILDENSTVVGYSAPLTGDLLRETVKWEHGNLEQFNDKTIRLRFKLRNGQFYSYWLE